MPIGELILGVGAVVIAADIATWCFKGAAKRERQNRRALARSERAHRYELVRKERAERRRIERETKRKLAQEKYEQRGEWFDMLSDSMRSVWELRTRTRELRRQFQEIVRVNQLLLKNSTLTFQQLDAIRDCIFHLELGIARLNAYSGPYLQIFISSIQEAKSAVSNDEFIDPDIPEAELPDDFPVVGDNLKLSAEETETLLRTGELPLGGNQVGRLPKSHCSINYSGESYAFVDEYDQVEFCWRLSLARGAVAQVGTGVVTESIDCILLSPSKGGFRAVWHSPYGESIDIFVPFALVDSVIRAAPWGTRLPLFIHQTDFRTRRIIGGQHRTEPLDDQGSILILSAASASVRSTIKQALEHSPSTFWLTNGTPESGLTGERIVLRVATGEEFSVDCNIHSGYLSVGEQIGYRLGNVEGAICRSHIALRFAEDIDNASVVGALTATNFLRRIRNRLSQQRELQAVFLEESLETRKYQLLLEAELEANRASSRIVFHYSTYHCPKNDDATNDGTTVSFLLETAPSTSDFDGFAVEVLPRLVSKSKRIRLCGFVTSFDQKSKTVSCSFSDDLYVVFSNHQIDGSGTLECSYVDTDTRRQVRALDQFRNVNFLQGKSEEDRDAFQNLRRVLLGLQISRKDSSFFATEYRGLDHLNSDQKSAVRIINSDSPLALVLGPPGTGKTDTIAVALEIFLRSFPKARVAIVSQANVAVDEALKKLKDRYPECDIVRHVSDQAVDTLMDSSKSLTQHARRDDFLKQLAAHLVLPEWATRLRGLFQHACSDDRFLKQHVLKKIVQSSAVYGCTLSVLARQSLGAALFDIVVVDEAAKASLPECMIAALSAKRLVLVGDHYQLLPFLDERILDRVGPLRADRLAVQDLWNNSLFRRLWSQAPETCKVQLTTQYRSRSGIREAVSALFYDGKLSPGRTDESDKVPFPCSLVWLDTKGNLDDQIVVKQSLVNEGEVGAILANLYMLANTLPNPKATSVAVICFYGEQRNLIERVFRNEPVTRAFKSCEARTVDASQGGQWDIVLLSLTRCSGGTSFVGNSNRLNVALSRARELAVVVGSFRYALDDYDPESKLGPLARYIQSKKGGGVWICARGPRGGIAPSYGFKDERATRGHL